MYAKRTCEPKIGDEAARELTAFYTHLRQTNLRSNGCNPITMRQLESLARLTQVFKYIKENNTLNDFHGTKFDKKARAKCELRSLCSGDDAREVIEIMKSSMVDYYENELGMLDISSMDGISSTPSAAGGIVGGSKSQQIKAFVAFLHNIAKQTKNNIFNVGQLKNAYEVSLVHFVLQINKDIS